MVLEAAQAYAQQVEEGAVFVEPNGSSQVDLGRQELVLVHEEQGQVGVDVPAKGVQEEGAFETTIGGHLLVLGLHCHSHVVP